MAAPTSPIAESAVRDCCFLTSLYRQNSPTVKKGVVVRRITSVRCHSGRSDIAHTRGEIKNLAQRLMPAQRNRTRASLPAAAGSLLVSSQCSPLVRRRPLRASCRAWPPASPLSEESAAPSTTLRVPRFVCTPPQPLGVRSLYTA
jgi:hypothetical protein